ncbi:PAS domain-containing protein [Kiloniella litopenaei]|uniref:PAS domain-containing protein n=1 Tax=Kiloniella litopenaei TaxID=1549748 RepID=UPI0009E56B54|nr:PAS domain-containing protein [Kiloniella litopenaei]
MMELKHKTDKIYDESFLDVCHVNIRAFFDFYCAKKQGRSMPSRSDFDPLEMKEYLPSITLVDVKPETNDFIYRLVGTKEVEIRGKDPTGKSIREEFYGELAEEAEENYRYVKEYKTFLYDHTNEAEKSSKIIHDETLFLPLSNNDTDVNMILLYSVQQYDQNK